MGSMLPYMAATWIRHGIRHGIQWDSMGDFLWDLSWFNET